MNAPLAKFDSAAAMAQALGYCLRREPFPAVGSGPLAFAFAAGANRLPGRVREEIFSWGGWSEALSPAAAGRLRDGDLAEWFTGCYPRRPFPGAVIGSSSGALVHLAAALGMPWLPQTALVPVALRGMDPDDPRRALERGYDPGRRLLAANPDLQLHQMHDPNQDRLMLQRMSYFRLKRRRLGAVYERFLDDVLEPGSTLIVAECGRTWPVTTLGPRHYFQFGAEGGATEAQYFNGGPEVADYLARYGRTRVQWDPPPPDSRAPEAEWGFEPALRADVERFAAARGHRVRRLRFDEPEDLSPLVADLYRDWYRAHGIGDRRLIAESFILLDPWWVLRTQSVPFWMKFNGVHSANALRRYLDQAGPFDKIGLTLFPHGIAGVGFEPIERWRELLGRAGDRGQFLGVEPDAYPRDLAALGRFHKAVRRFGAHGAPPPTVGFDELERVLRTAGADRSVQLE